MWKVTTYGTYTFDVTLGKTGHSYTSKITEPTCTEQGYTTHTCHCGSNYTDSYVDALGHDYDSWYVSIQPDCTEKGEERRDCKRCDYYETAQISADGHTLEQHAGREATCTEHGWEDYEVCEKCDYSTYVEIPAKGHSEAIDPVVAATCTSTGLTEGKHCTVCEAVLIERGVIPALGHDYVDGDCTRCGERDPNAPAITITSQPSDYVGMVGDMATFTVEAEGEDLQYQWYYSSDNGATWLKSSGTGSTLTTEFRPYRVNYQYYCQITDAAGNTMNSNAVRLLAEQVELKILTQPVSYVGAVNDEVTFTVEATGNGLVYEWFYSEDGGNVWNKSYSPGYETNVFSPVLRTHRDGNMYYCVITDIFGNSVTSDVVSMSVKASDVVIVKQPKSNVNCILSQLYQFTVEATGENLTYRWEFSDDGGNTWQESWNDGYNTPVLNVRMNANRDGNQYRCVVTSGLKTVAISDPAVLDLQDPSVEIISNSGNVYVVAGDMATFTVTAVGSDLTYQWYRSDDDGATWYQTYLDGYNTDTLSFKATTQRAVKYLCKITDGSGKSVWSAPVKLQILSGELAILEQPVSVTCRLGETAKFTVKAQGDSLKYRWYASADGGETWTMSYLDGCDTAEFSFVVNALRASKVYKCVITDVAGNTVQTDVVSVTVE